jgi:hypothetical protein
MEISQPFEMVLLKLIIPSLRQQHIILPFKNPPVSLSFFFIYTKLVWPVPLAQVLPRPQLIFPSKTCFFGIYLNFQLQKSLKNQYLPHSESKSYQINSIKSCSSRSSREHRKAQFHRNFQLDLI